jgi:hypothetical protein
VILLDEATRGIEAGAQIVVQSAMRGGADGGAAEILAATDIRALRDEHSR